MFISTVFPHWFNTILKNYSTNNAYHYRYIISHYLLLWLSLHYQYHYIILDNNNRGNERQVSWQKHLLQQLLFPYLHQAIHGKKDIGKKTCPGYINELLDTRAISLMQSIKLIYLYYYAKGICKRKKSTGRLFLSWIVKFQSKSQVLANKEKPIVILFTTSSILHQTIQAQLPV